MIGRFRRRSRSVGGEGWGRSGDGDAVGARPLGLVPLEADVAGGRFVVVEVGEEVVVEQVLVETVVVGALEGDDGIVGGQVDRGLLAHEATWSEYLAGNPTWQQTAIVLTGPLLVANVVLGLIFSRLVGGYATYGYHGGFVAALVIGFVFGLAVHLFFVGFLNVNLPAGLLAPVLGTAGL